MFYSVVSLIPILNTLPDFPQSWKVSEELDTFLIMLNIWGLLGWTQVLKILRELNFVTLTDPLPTYCKLTIYYSELTLCKCHALFCKGAD